MAVDSKATSRSGRITGVRNRPKSDSLGELLEAAEAAVSRIVYTCECVFIYNCIFLIGTY